MRRLTLSLLLLGTSALAGPKNADCAKQCGEVAKAASASCRKAANKEAREEHHNEGHAPTDCGQVVGTLRTQCLKKCSK